MASTRSGSSSKTAKAKTATRGRKTTSTKANASRRRSRPKSRAKQPSTQEKLVQAVRSAKGPGIAAGAVAGLAGAVALGVRRKRSSGFDARGLAKRLGKTTKSLGKTSKELGKEMQRLGDDAESVGKTLS